MYISRERRIVRVRTVGSENQLRNQKENNEVKYLGIKELHYVRTLVWRGTSVDFQLWLPS